MLVGKLLSGEEVTLDFTAECRQAWHQSTTL